MSIFTSCQIKYVVKGVTADREDKDNLRTEMLDTLPEGSFVTLLPVVEGFSLEMEISDISPFTEKSFEPYLSEQILLEAIGLKCKSRGPVSIELIKINFL